MNETKPPKKKNYLNNADLMTQIRLSKEKGRMTEELGKMCIKLVEKYAKHPNYANIYSYKEDMQAFAIMTLTKAWKYFNPDKSNNPFAYLTQVSKHAFYLYLNTEKKQRLIVNEYMAKMGLSNMEFEDELFHEFADATPNVDTSIEKSDTEVTDI